ncbi:glycosyltransferase [Haloferula rosea]|uniref:Glycosyltransferase n=1 Tax=Haloferula rosea TaxID=490093 RepID=A0A934R9A3_9BACT|nr:glycosyltransferase [Haloferula rosea]MBK1827564.1 glycosyltransferase [Haloferula rosea]
MRFDIVTDTFAPDVNGVAMTLSRLVDGLRERGHMVHIIRTGGANGARQTVAPSVSLPGYKEVRIGLPGPFKLRKRWMKRRPDAIYVATESPLGVSAIRAAKSLEIPAATGFHTNFHQYMEQYRLGGLQPAAMAYLKRVHRRANVTMAPTAEVVSMLEDEGFENVALMGRGVDTRLFQPSKRDPALRAEWGARGGSPVALIVGRVAAEKNLVLAMECFRRMRERVPDLQCVCVGGGPLLETLKEKNSFVHFAGVRTGRDLARYYASSDILLFPSETETFGNVLLEAMASGLVTVSYDYAASAQHVRHGINGLKATKGNSHEFVELAEDSLVRWQGGMREQALRTTSELGWDRVVDVFEGNLGRIAREGRRRSLSLKQRKQQLQKEYRTVFISDVHLGTPDSKVHEVIDFLKQVRCRKLVLNGDIIDGWALKRGSRWRKRHSRFIRQVLKKVEKEDTEVIYCRGNHDDILDRFLPLAFGPVNFVKEHIHHGVDGKKYLVVHGDGFDSVSTHHKWLARLGAVCYDSMLSVNRLYNRFRAWRGKGYYSLSKKVKARVKSAVSFVDNYEFQLQQYARHRKCDGIICGHIHTPEDKQVEGIHYLNSGDWVESLTAIVEHVDGRMELISYEEFLDAQSGGPPRGSCQDHHASRESGSMRKPVNGEASLSA